MDEKYNAKRINPPIWQHDYHVLKGLHKILKHLIAKYVNNNLVVLDYGSGTSPYKDLFDGKSVKYIRADIDKTVRPDYILSENKNIPLKNGSIDVIISTQVLEHIKNPNFYLQECARLLGRGDLLLLSTHGIWPYHPYPEDFHRWTKTGLTSQIKDSGFKILEVNSILGPFAATSQFELLLIAQKLVEKGLLPQLLLKIISVIGNIYIYFEDKLSPATATSDSSLFVICAKKT